MKEVEIHSRQYFYGQRPTWRPLLDANGRPMGAATPEAAREVVAGLRGSVYYLRHGEYSAPDYGIRGQDGKIRPIEP